MYKFYQLAIALQFLKVDNKGLVQAEKDKLVEFANKLELGVSFDSFEELVAIIKFKMSEAHIREDLLSYTPMQSIKTLLSIASFDCEEIANIIWTLINLAYADGEFSKYESAVIKLIANEFKIQESVVEELKDCAKTLICLEAKSEWIETTKKSYKEIKAVKDEIEKDKALVTEMIVNIINNTQRR